MARHSLKEKEATGKELPEEGGASGISSEDAQDQREEAKPGTEDDFRKLLLDKDEQLSTLAQELLYQRAEFENFRKRTEKRYRDALDFATEPFAKDLLSVVDNLDRALAHAKDAGPQGLDSLLEGLGHVLAQFQQILGNHGVCEVPAQGEKFDPNVHESLAQVPGPEDNQVMEVYQKGYLLKGRLLRPATVVISKIATSQGDG